MFTTISRRLLAASILTSLAIATPGLAAPVEQAQDIHLASGPLGTALQALAAQTQVEVIFSPATVAGLRSSALNGRYTVEDALHRLLLGTGIEADHSSASVIVLHTRAAPINHGTRLTPVSATMQDGLAAPLALSPAQQTPLPDPVPVSEVVVTGTHIRGVRAIASPTVEITRQDLQRDGDATVAGALARLPQNFNGAASPNSLVLGTDHVGTNISAAQGVNLRGLGASATLVLIDGRRLAGTGNQGDFVDVSALPTAAVDHVEILLDGASAIYGSDAVGGVVNIITRKNFEGAETSFRAGTDAGGVGSSGQFSHTVGVGWTGGHLLAAFEYQHDDPLASASRRYTRDSNLTALGGTNHDSIDSSPGNILGFNSSGVLSSLYAIPGGAGVGLKASDFIAGATNYENNQRGTDLLPEQDRASAFASLRQTVDSRTTLFAQGRFSWREFQFNSTSEKTSFTVTKANPFFVSPNGAASQTIGYATDITGPEDQAGTSVSWDGAVGFEREFGRTWRLQGYVGYAEEVGRSVGNGLWNTAHLNEALGNTADNPATPFSTAKDGFFNPYGDGSSNSKAVLDFINDGFIRFKDISQVTTVSLQADGTLFHLPGGDVKAAIGTQYRHERFDTGLYELAAATPFVQTPIPVGRDISAAFAELHIPLVGPQNAIPGIQRLELSLAGRVEHYDDVGTTENPKLGLVWVPAPDWALHASYGTSFRAPTLPEVNNALAVYPLTLNVGGGQSVVALLEQGGNPGLKPQTARTWTAGVTWTPHQLPGLELGVNGFSVDFKNQIAQPASANIIAALTNPAFSSLITHINNASANDEAKVVALLSKVSPALAGVYPVTAFSTIIDNRFVNTSALEVAGVDFTGRYGWTNGPDHFGLSGSISYLTDYTQHVTPTSPALDQRSTAGFPVDLRGRTTADWSRGPYAVAATLNYTNSYKDAVSGRSIGSWTTLDTSVSWTSPMVDGPARGVVITLAVQNLLDQDPPFYDATFGIGYDPANANPLGRVVSLQVNKRW